MVGSGTKSMKISGLSFPGPGKVENCSKHIAHLGSFLGYKTELMGWKIQPTCAGWFYINSTWARIAWPVGKPVGHFID